MPRPLKPQNRRGIWTLIRFVPKAYKKLDRRSAVRVSTGIRVADDPACIRAYETVQRLNAELEAYWRSLSEGAPRPPISAETAREYARSLGLIYRSAADLAAGPMEEVVRRLELLERGNLLDDAKAVAAVAGGVPKKKIALSTMLEEFEALKKADLQKYSPDQLRRWRNAKKKAVADLISVLGGDMYLADMTRDHALDFRDWWQDRIIGEGVQIDTANKAFGHVGKMWRELDKTHRLNLAPIFSEMRIEGGKTGQRHPYPIDFVQGHILADGALDGLNTEARRIVYLCAETGLRPVEAANLTKQSIILDHEVPHILIRPEGRVLKTDHSKRHIPLTGVALEVMKLQPDGFPTYFDRSPTLSATVNKFLLENNFRPDPKQSLYSLRHTFEDRLTAIEPPEKIQAYLMGHKYSRPKYGSPPSLEQLAGWLTKISFRAPASV